MPYDLRWPLLDMAEGLIKAHKAAKVDGDEASLDLIESALFHVGRRLADDSDRFDVSARGHRVAALAIEN